MENIFIVEHIFTGVLVVVAAFLLFLMMYALNHDNGDGLAACFLLMFMWLIILNGLVGIREGIIKKLAQEQEIQVEVESE
jgi:succinate dehydrogenase/fumarate reductase cytochrome b subunit